MCLPERFRQPSMKTWFSPVLPSLPIPIVSSFSRYPKAVIAPEACFLSSVSCREFYEFVTQQGTRNNREKENEKRDEKWFLRSIGNISSNRTRHVSLCRRSILIVIKKCNDLHWIIGYHVFCTVHLEMRRARTTIDSDKCDTWNKLFTQYLTLFDIV